MPDYVARRLPRHHWKLLRPVPAWDGVLYYDPIDIQLDRPLTFYRRLHHRRLGDIIYPVKSWKKDVKIWQRKHGCNAKPMFREFIKIRRKGTLIPLYVSQLTMHCMMGFTILHDGLHHRRPAPLGGRSHRRRHAEQPTIEPAGHHTEREPKAQRSQKGTSEEDWATQPRQVQCAAACGGGGKENGENEEIRE